MIKLWHDDWREPPTTEWVWAKTNEQAQAVLENGWPIVEISMDHDLGLHDVEIPDDPDEFITVAQEHFDPDGPDGTDLVRWMIASGYVPPRITIHSHNPDRAKEMAALFNDAGHNVYLTPFEGDK
jgi:hypothetical protein